MKDSKVMSFRKDLRAFESLLGQQLKHTTCCNSVTLAQCHTLMALYELKETSLNDLARVIKVDKSTASRTVEGLFKRGLVNRKADPNNRRLSIINLSEKGLSKVDSINQENNYFFNSVLSHLPKDQVGNVINSFKLLTNALEKEILKGE